MFCQENLIQNFWNIMFCYIEFFQSVVHDFVSANFAEQRMPSSSDSPKPMADTDIQDADCRDDL